MDADLARRVARQLAAKHSDTKICFVIDGKRGAPMLDELPS